MRSAEARSDQLADAVGRPAADAEEGQLIIASVANYFRVFGNGGGRVS